MACMGHEMYHRKIIMLKVWRQLTQNFRKHKKPDQSLEKLIESSAELFQVNPKFLDENRKKSISHGIHGHRMYNSSISDIKA